MNLAQFLVFISENALSKPDRFLKPGHNGPYNDIETSVRNFGHWIITFSKSYELAPNKLIFHKLEELADYLMTIEARPQSFAFHHRDSLKWDKCNGLIGQAWTFEALACASSILGKAQYSELAEEVFFQHKFNIQFGLWNRLGIDGRILPIDDTFNHQLWFAACSSLLNTPRRNEIRERVLRFMDCLSENLSIMENGLIYHPIKRDIRQKTFKKSGVLNVRYYTKFLQPFWGKKQQSNDNNEIKRKMIHKSTGYHHFNMYAFAILKEKLPDHSFWKLPAFDKTINYLVSDEFKNQLINNKYGYPYNPPGFEVPYALSVFSDLTTDEIAATSSLWVNEQLSRCYNPHTQMMDRNTEDALTHTARIYELTRLKTSMLERIKVQV